MIDTQQPPDKGKFRLLEPGAPNLQVRLLKVREAPAQGFDFQWITPRFLDKVDADCPVCAADSAPKVSRKTAVNVVEWAPKQHRKRRWMTEAYHRRVQKKWNARAATDPRFRAFKEVQVGRLPSEALDNLQAAITKLLKGSHVARKHSASTDDARRLLDGHPLQHLGRPE